jgi:hypothetical protein
MFPRLGQVQKSVFQVDFIRFFITFRLKKPSDAYVKLLHNVFEP